MRVTAEARQESLKTARAVIASLTATLAAVRTLGRFDDASCAYMLQAAENRLDMVLETIRLYGRELTKTQPNAQESSK